MQSVKVAGKVVSQPVVFNLANEIEVLILVDDHGVWREFYYSTYVNHNESLPRKTVNTVLSEIALSSVGDKVEIVLWECKSERIASFVNVTRRQHKL